MFYSCTHIAIVGIKGLKYIGLQWYMAHSADSRRYCVYVCNMVKWRTNTIKTTCNTEICLTNPL